MRKILFIILITILLSVFVTASFEDNAGEELRYINMDTTGSNRQDGGTNWADENFVGISRLGITSMDEGWSPLIYDIDFDGASEIIFETCDVLVIAKYENDVIVFNVSVILGDTGGGTCEHTTNIGFIPYSVNETRLYTHNESHFLEIRYSMTYSTLNIINSVPFDTSEMEIRTVACDPLESYTTASLYVDSKRRCYSHTDLSDTLIIMEYVVDNSTANNYSTVIGAGTDLYEDKSRFFIMDMDWDGYAEVGLSTHHYKPGSPHLQVDFSMLDNINLVGATHTIPAYKIAGGTPPEIRHMLSAFHPWYWTREYDAQGMDLMITSGGGYAGATLYNMLGVVKEAYFYASGSEEVANAGVSTDIVRGVKCSDTLGTSFFYPDGSTERFFGFAGFRDNGDYSLFCGTVDASPDIITLVDDYTPNGEVDGTSLLRAHYRTDDYEESNYFVGDDLWAQSLNEHFEISPLDIVIGAIPVDLEHDERQELIIWGEDYIEVRDKDAVILDLNLNPQINSITREPTGDVCNDSYIVFELDVEDPENDGIICYMNVTRMNNVMIDFDGNFADDEGKVYFSYGFNESTNSYRFKFFCFDDVHTPQDYDELLTETVTTSNSESCFNAGDGDAQIIFDFEAQAEQSEFKSNIEATFENLGIDTKSGQWFFFIALLLMMNLSLVMSGISNMYALMTINSISVIGGWVLGIVPSTLIIILGLLIVLGITSWIFLGRGQGSDTGGG